MTYPNNFDTFVACSNQLGLCHGLSPSLTEKETRDKEFLERFQGDLARRTGQTKIIELILFDVG